MVNNLLVFTIYGNKILNRNVDTEQKKNQIHKPEKSNQAKTDFLSNMTYEIKIPMNVIISICDVIINIAKIRILA